MKASAGIQIARDPLSTTIGMILIYLVGYGNYAVCYLSPETSTRGQIVDTLVSLGIGPFNRL